MLFTKSFIKINGQELIDRCQKRVSEYRNMGNYSVFNQPYTKGLQRATRLEWVLQKLTKENATTERVFLELFKFYEKEETDSRLRDYIFTQLCDAIGINDNQLHNKTTIYNELLQQLGKTWIEVDFKDDNAFREKLVILAADKCRVNLSIKHPRFKYTVSELLDQCREFLVGHQDKNSYSYWNKPGKKGFDREVKLDLLLNSFKSNTDFDCTEENVFIAICQFYQDDNDTDSRLRDDIGKTLLRMLNVNVEAKDKWNEACKVFLDFTLGEPDFDLMQNMTDYILNTVCKKLISEKNSSEIKSQEMIIIKNDK